MGPTQPPPELVLKALSWGFKLTTHSHIVPWLRMCGT